LQLAVGFVAAVVALRGRHGRCGASCGRRSGAFNAPLCRIHGPFDRAHSLARLRRAPVKSRLNHWRPGGCHLGTPQHTLTKGTLERWVVLLQMQVVGGVLPGGSVRDVIDTRPCRVQ
jgi:hypothetical protein